MFVVKGADSVYCKRDRCRHFSLVLASLDELPRCRTTSILIYCLLANHQYMAFMFFSYMWIKLL